MGGLLILWAAQARGDDPNAPRISAKAIMLRAVQRTRTAHRLPDCHYFERTAERDLDSRGRLEKETDELYRVVVRDGMPHSSLVELNGRNLTPAEAQHKEKQEQQDEEKLRGHRAGLENARPQTLLTRDLVDRYSFTLLDMVDLHGRKTYRLAFRPRPALRMRSMVDRFFNHIAGTIWIDAQDYELARAEIHLTSEFKLWAGILADVKRCEFVIDETRLPDGTWLNKSVHGEFEARKFLVTSRIEISTEAMDIQVAPRAAMARSPRPVRALAARARFQ